MSLSPKAVFQNIIDTRNNTDRSIFSLPPVKTIREKTFNQLVFNVMPNRPVEEILKIKEYRIWDRCIEARFDREYHSSMDRSPNHLIFLSALVHLQKMLYVYFCDEFGLQYDPFGPEKLKIWPTKVEVNMPKMITETDDLKHQVIIDNFMKTNENAYYGSSTSFINDLMVIRGEAAILT